MTSCRSENFIYDLFANVHSYIKDPTHVGKTYLIKGDFNYYHYKCDGFNDVGWGCAYRTLQSICSWIINTKSRSIDIADRELPPTIQNIQETLVNINDKPLTFLGSRDWIGALEVCYVIDTLYNVSCKIQHITRNENIQKYTDLLTFHFQEFGSLVMIGGDIDASSKGIAGIHIADNDVYLLVIDPHFIGIPTNVNEIINKNYLRWQHTTDFICSSFYNICLPQIKWFD